MTDGLKCEVPTNNRKEIYLETINHHRSILHPLHSIEQKRVFKIRVTMRFLEATVLAAAVSLSSAALFGPNQPKVAFANRRGLVSSPVESSLDVTLETRGGASKKKKKKAEKVKEDEIEGSVPAEKLYLPGLLNTVIRRTNEVGPPMFFHFCA